jgi:YD repeat-containing protein
MSLSYDAAGRVVQRQHRDRTGQQQTVRYQYQGEYLQKVENPSQTTEYARDANGRVIEERVTLRTRAGHADTYVTKTAYDQLRGNRGQITISLDALRAVRLNLYVNVHVVVKSSNG